MNNVLEFLTDFVIMFILVFLVYKLFYRKKTDFSKLSQRDTLRDFVLKYDLDVRKLDYKKLLNTVILMNSFIIAFAGAIITRIENFMWSIIVCLAVVMILMYALFNIAGKYFQKEQSNYKEKTVDDSIKEVVKESKKKTTKKTTKRKRVNKDV